MKHKAKPSGSGGGSRLRLALLAFAAAVFFLVPVAQAAAESTLTVNIAGTGSGEISSAEGYFGFYKGTPPIECSGPPATGVCENEVDEEVVALKAIPAPGSAFAGWTIEEGEAIIGCVSSIEEAVEETEENFRSCLIYAEEEEDAKVTATFITKAFTLTVTPEGTGSGTVVSNPAGIECGGTCSAAYAENTEVTLTASPAAGSTFTSWKKCDTGKVEGRKCTVKMSLAKTVGAKFSPTYDVTVKKTAGSTGLGAVSGVACDANCSSATAAFVVGKAATLKPKASKGSAFTEWSSCPGEIVESVNCKMTSAGTAEVKFTAIPKFSLTVNKIGGGQGTVKSTPASINCGLTCSTQTSSFEEGKEVELTASVTALKGSSFGGWSGGGGTCTGLTNPCKMPAITGTQSVTAEFK